MTHSDMHHGTLIGTIGGTLLTIFTLHSEDIIKTAILASFGAIVSFTVSLSCKYLYKKFKEKFTK